MTTLTTSLAVWRPSQQWTTLFKHDPYAPALWALVFEPSETLMASEHFGAEWGRISADAVVADHVVGYRTQAGLARQRLVARLEPVRGFSEAWRVLSLTGALALALAALPPDWPLRFDASAVTVRQGGRYGDLMAAAIARATNLATQPPQSNEEAIEALSEIVHGMNPETILRAPAASGEPLPWPADGPAVGRALLGVPVDCPTSHVEAMTRARHRWEAAW